MGGLGNLFWMKANMTGERERLIGERERLIEERGEENIQRIFRIFAGPRPRDKWGKADWEKVVFLAGK
jgi:hypothetical protein